MATRGSILTRLPGPTASMLTGYARAAFSPTLALVRATVAPSGRWLSAPVDPGRDRAMASMSGFALVPAPATVRPHPHSLPWRGHAR